MKIIRNITMALALLVSGVTATQTLTYSFGTPITNSVVPYGTGPWLTIQLMEVNGYTNIQMGSNLTNGEFVGEVGFNLNTTANYDSLFFTPETVGIFTIPQFNVGNDAFNAGGGNSFDMIIQFSTSNANNGSGRFNLNDEFSFNVNTPISTFTNIGDQLPALVHIQGIGQDTQSTWMVPNIPEPSAILLGSVGLILLLNRRNRNV